MHRSAPQLAFAGPGRCHPGGGHPGWHWMARHAHGRGGGQPRHGGGPGFGWGGFGPGGPGGPGFRRGRRARRGDVRTAVLLLLAEEPRNGYQIMQELEERSEGAWRPSAGSIYPALQLLEDEGLIRSEEIDGRKLLHLTDAGHRLVQQRPKGQPAPWDELAGDDADDARAIMKVAKEVMIAAAQVMQSGSESQRAQARQLLAGVRRDLYRILADGDDAEAGA